MKKRKYEFDLNDIVAIIELLCVIGIICGLDMCVPFIIACTIGLIIGIRVKRINICVINIAIIILNIYYLVG